MRVTVLGCGRWGSFLAAYHSRQHSVLLWGREGSENLARLQNEGKNKYLTMPKEVAYTSDLAGAVAFSDYIFISISAQALAEFATRLASLPVEGKTFILCMKGIEADTGRRLTQVMADCIRKPVHVAVWVGPGHVEDFTRGVPNCQVVDSAEPAVTADIVEKFSSALIRLYIGKDIIGSEIGAAAKNVVGIAAGMLDGLGLTSLKGALMARGAREVARLIKAMGGSELSAYGLCHLGDYEATLFSPHSHNRAFGEGFVQNRPYTELAEGAATAKAMVRLAEDYGVEVPICRVVYEMLYEGKNVQDALPELFARSIKGEFDY